MTRDTELVVKDFKERTRGSRRYLTEEVERGLVALSIINLMKDRSEFGARPFGPYLTVFDEACKALHIGEY